MEVAHVEMEAWDSDTAGLSLLDPSPAVGRVLALTTDDEHIARVRVQPQRFVRVELAVMHDVYVISGRADEHGLRIDSELLHVRRSMFVSGLRVRNDVTASGCSSSRRHRIHATDHDVALKNHRIVVLLDFLHVALLQVLAA